MTYRLESQGRGYEQPDTVPGNPAPTNRRQQRGVNTHVGTTASSNGIAKYRVYITSILGTKQE